MAVRYFNVERFWSKVRIGAPEDCWEWTASRNKFGYGRCGVPGPSCWEQAHRVAWRVTNGDIPDGLHVLHRCDNPPCCNPAHLFLGTQADNMADKLRKGRNVYGDEHWARRRPEWVRRGEKVPQAKLTEDDIRAIRSSSETGETLGQRYGVKREAIDKIRRRERWRHVV